MPRAERTFNTLLRVVLTDPEEGYVERLCPDTPDFRSYLFARPRRRGRSIMPVQLAEMHDFLLNANYPLPEERVSNMVRHINVFRGRLYPADAVAGVRENDYKPRIMRLLEHPRRERFGENYEALRDFKTNLVAIIGFSVKSADHSILQAADNAGYKITRVLEAPMNRLLFEEHGNHGPPICYSYIPPEAI